MNRERSVSWWDGHELRRLLAIMLPLYVGNLMQIGMGVIDTIVAGQAGAGELAAVALGCSLTAPVICSFGVIISMVGPVISRLHGAGCDSRVGYVLHQAKCLAVVLTVVELLILAVSHWVWPLVTGDAALAARADAYIRFYMLGIPANLLLRVALAHFEGFSRTRPGMVFSFLGMLLNVPLNFLFVFGWGPLPAMGGAGCGLSTALIFWMMALGLLLTMRFTPRYRANLRALLALRRPNTVFCRRILRLGYPVGLATVSEVGFFSVVVMVIAPLGELAVAAQQVAISVSSLVFMFPLSMSWAVSIRAAYHIGAQNASAFRRMVRTSVAATLAGVLFFMVGSILLRGPIVGLYTQNAEVQQMAQTLILLCAIYQISDGIQSLMNGLLRGCQDTAALSRITILCYWCVGFPLACILIRTDWVVPAMGPAGAWVSFIVSLSLTALLLSLRFRRTARGLLAGKLKGEN